jgi:hypothetical protein
MRHARFASLGDFVGVEEAENLVASVLGNLRVVPLDPRRQFLFGGKPGMMANWRHF